MRLRYDITDPGDAAGGGGGADAGGGGGALFERYLISITWDFPANAPDPSAFEVVAYTGSDPTDTTKYLWLPARVLGADRLYERSIFPKTNLTTINVAVRAVYA